MTMLCKTNDYYLSNITLHVVSLLKESINVVHAYSYDNHSWIKISSCNILAELVIYWVCGNFRVICFASPPPLVRWCLCKLRMCWSQARERTQLICNTFALFWNGQNKKYFQNIFTALCPWRKIEKDERLNDQNTSRHKSFEIYNYT